MPLDKTGFFNHSTFTKFKTIFGIFNKFILFFYLPLILIIVLIYPFYKIRFGQIYTKTLGNSVLSTEILFYELKKNDFFVKSRGVNIWCTHKIISNKFWLKKIKSELIILPGILVFPIFNFFKYFNFGKSFLIPERDLESSKNPHKIKSIEDLAQNCDIHGVLIENPPLIKFDVNEASIGNSFLMKNKILMDDKIICIHTRTSSYRNEKSDSTRNSSIENFEKTINFLTDKGFKVIRMGRDEKKPFNTNNKNFFDYSACNEQNDFLDFFIISKCIFFIGATSGLAHIAKIFRKPILYHNMFHLPDMIHFDGNYEKIILPKKIYLNNLNEYMRYKKTFEKNYKKPKAENKLEFSNIKIVENTEEEIYFATKEMYDLIIKKKDFNLSQKNFYDNFEKFYKNPLVKKTLISEKFYLENIELFT